MLVVCVNYSGLVDKRMLQFVAQAQKKLAHDKMMETITKTYEQKEKLILDKQQV